MKSRLLMLTLSLASFLVMGVTCLPLINLGGGDENPPPRTTLGIAVLKPTQSRSIPAGTVVEIEFTASNLTGEAAVATVLVRNRRDQSETIVAGGLRILTQGVRRSVDWDTAGFDLGVYEFVVRIETGTRSAEDTGTARLTLDGVPVLEFTEPFENTILKPSDDPDRADEEPTVRIRWSGFDPEGTATAVIGVDLDTDHESGNEIILQENVVLDAESSFRSIEWDGQDGNARAEPGSYYAFAIVDDGVNPAQTIRAPGRIIVDGLPTLEFTAPEEDVTLGALSDPDDEDSERITSVSIEWVGSDAEGRGRARIGVDIDDDHESGNEIILVSSFVLGSEDSEGSFEWDGKDSKGERVPGGEYRIFAILTDPVNAPITVTAEARITVNGVPEFRFTAPERWLTFGNLSDPNDADSDEITSVTIEWAGSDAEGTARVKIGLDPDDDHESGNEIIIEEEFVLGVDETTGSFEWDGTDNDGEPAPVGIYTIFAIITEDEEGDEASIIIEARPRIRIRTQKTAVVEPSEDMSFLVGDDPVRIEMEFVETQDVLIDIAVDLDDLHTNGNETVIRAQRLIERRDEEDYFLWNGNGADKQPVADGIYRVFMAVNRGEGAPQTYDSEGLIFRRSFEEQPLIALLEPAEEVEVKPGQFLLIRWRDDVPDDVEATIRLTIDDDPFPNEDVETGEPEIQILANRDARGDGVLDTFQYQVGNLPDGEYYIFAYIDRDGVAPYDHVSRLPGKLIIGTP